VFVAGSIASEHGVTSASSLVPLAEATRDPKPAVRAAAKAAMQQCVRPDKDVEGLVRMLSHGDVGLRLLAARRLGAAGHPSALEPLLGALSDTSKEVRLAAAESLEKLIQPESRGVDSRLRARLSLVRHLQRPSS
jgi:HEAT repeat protein